MKQSTISQRLLTTLLVAAIGAGTAAAQSNQGGGKQKDDTGGGEIYAHGKNPHGESPTPGSAAASTAPIINHLGPVMASPRAYLIWYGNWNQSNGSDTPAGKALVRAFLGSI